MKRINVIVMILLSLVAFYLFYALIKESWGRNENILLIVLLAGGMINSSFIDRNRKKERRGGSNMSENSILDKD